MPPSTIPLRKLGDRLVPAIGLGLMGAGGAYGSVDSTANRLQLLDAAYEAGARHWDTADVYGDSEDIIGQWIKLNPEKRGEVFLSTKVGFTMTGGRGDPAYVRQQCELSLKRMGVDYIDLYYQHRVDANIPIETTIGTMAELVKEGKIKYLGLSDCTASGLRRASSVHPIAALQIEFSPVNLDVEHEPLNLIQAARSLGIKIICYSPLGRGFITGQIKSFDELHPQDFRRTSPKYGPDNFPKILELAGKIAEVGKKHNASAGQTILAWDLAQGPDFFVIPGARQIKYLVENAAAARVGLTEEEVLELRRIAEDTDLPGERYGPGVLELTYVESPPL